MRVKLSARWLSSSAEASRLQTVLACFETFTDEYAAEGGEFIGCDDWYTPFALNFPFERVFIRYLDLDLVALPLIWFLIFCRLAWSNKEITSKLGDKIKGST